MTTPRVQPAARPHLDAAPAPEGPFVINLCSSTTPVALTHPQDAELKRFSFFVSRRLEDGRERFRLHMGFFTTLPEAEEWLSVVREVYPGAWAGEAPGKRLGGKLPAPIAAGMQSASAATPETAQRLRPAPLQHASALPAARVPAAARASATARAPAAARFPAAARPSEQPARPTATKPQTGHPQPPTVFPPSTAARAAGPTGPQSVARAASGGSPRPAPVSPGAQLARASNVRAVTAGAARGASPSGTARPARAPKSGAVAPLPLSNVREVLAALDETGSTQQMPALDKMPTFEKPATDTATAPRLSDSQVLKLLETRRPERGRAADDSSISLLKPDDTGTRRELREAIATNAPVSFAVQLLWSVQPIEVEKLPPLAIFSAYTLYTVEGSREGRRWYGLRLGFFGDAISAKQVAQYVRSEFASVAVVPVGAQERGRASANEPAGKGKAGAPAASVRNQLPGEAEFKLIDESQTAPAVAPVTAAAKSKASAKAQAAAPQKRSRGGAVRAREKRSPQTLEETLEILGADKLEIDEGGGDPLNDTGVRHLKVEMRRESPFTKLLDRLAERARKPR